MYRILSIAAIVLAAAFSSCQRPVDEVVQPSPPEPEEPPVVVTGDSTLVSKLIQVGHPGSGSTDTAGFATYQYDSLRRTTEAIYHEVNGSSVFVSKVIRYYYNGNDTLPWKMTRRDRYVDYPESNSDDTMYVTYQNGLVIADSTVYRRPTDARPWKTEINKLVVRGDTSYMYNRSIDAATNEPWDQVYLTVVRRVNGNLVEIWNDGRFLGGHYIMEYNDHPDPLRRTYVPFPFYWHDWEWGMEAYTNLPTKSLNAVPPVPNDPWYFGGDNYEYEYRADGYPLKRIVTNNLDDNYVLVYQYHKR